MRKADIQNHVPKTHTGNRVKAGFEKSRASIPQGLRVLGPEFELFEFVVMRSHGQNGHLPRSLIIVLVNVAANIP